MVSREAIAKCWHHSGTAALGDGGALSQDSQVALAVSGLSHGITPISFIISLIFLNYLWHCPLPAGPRQADQPIHANRWAKKSEAGTCSNSVFLPSVMLSIFPFPCLLRDVMWQRSTHLTSRLLSTVATAFPVRKRVSPYLVPKTAKHLQALLERHQAFLSTMPSPG